MVEEVRSYKVMTLGNPLLDISVEVEDASLLKKYGLDPNDTVLAQEKHLSLYKELQARPNCMLIPGGAGLNSLRTAQWILKEKYPKSCAYVGAIGTDKIGEKLEQLILEETVIPFLEKRPKTETGKCGVILYDMNRSLVTDLCAASYCGTEFIQSKWNEIEKVKVFYVAGYFLSTNKESLIQVAKYANDTEKTFIFNLSATFWVEIFFKEIREIMKYCDVIICNEDECLVFGKLAGYQSECVGDIIQEMLNEDSYNNKPTRAVIVTAACNPTTIFVKGDANNPQTPITVPVPCIGKHKMVDTNGAGDAFAGGFSAGISLGKSYMQSVEIGLKAARYIVCRSGATFDVQCSIEV